MKVYVAGPINSSGLFIENLRNALQAATMLRKAGHTPFVPNLFMPWQIHTPMSEEEMLAMDKEWLLTCDAMVRLPGESRGADQEEQWAAEAGIPVYRKLEPYCGDTFTPVRLFLAEVNAGRFRKVDPIAGPPPPDDHPNRGMWPENNPVYGALRIFQGEVASWLRRQPFGDQTGWEPLVGMQEELGELAHAHLKHHQKIRGFGDAEFADDKKRDAIGDLMVYMAGYCVTNHLSLGACLERAWEEVKRRDWNQNATTGDVPNGDVAVGPENRRTGRTTTLLRQAMVRARMGKKVLFVVRSTRFIETCWELMGEPHNLDLSEGCSRLDRRDRVDFPGGGHIRFGTEQDIRDLKLKGLAVNVTIWDHDAEGER